MTPYNLKRKLAEKIEPRWYQTNANLGQPPTTGADRPVREYVTNIRWRAVQGGGAANGRLSGSMQNRPATPVPKPSVTAYCRALLLRRLRHLTHRRYAVYEAVGHRPSTRVQQIERLPQRRAAERV